MIELGNIKYNLNNRDEREEFHGIIDDLVMEHRATELITGKDRELSERLSYLHELVSERDELSVAGKWFDLIEIKYWHDSVIDYFEDMGLEYTQPAKGNIVVEIEGDLVLLTRGADTLDLEQCVYDRIVEVPQGKVTEAMLNSLGLRPDKPYYLEK